MSSPRKNKIYEQLTKADQVCEELRAEGIWVERVWSGVIRAGNQLFDLKSRGLPQLYFPNYGGWMYVLATRSLNANQTIWYNNFYAATEGTRIAVVHSIEDARKVLESWT